MSGGQRTADGEEEEVSGGRRTADGGEEEVNGGQRTADGERALSALSRTGSLRATAYSLQPTTWFSFTVRRPPSAVRSES